MKRLVGRLTNLMLFSPEWIERCTGALLASPTRCNGRPDKAEKVYVQGSGHKNLKSDGEPPTWCHFM